MPTSTELLASYAPSLILRALSKNPALGVDPTSAPLPAAVLFADITGFTALTERLGQSGPSGAEEMTSILNAYFEPLVALVNAHGGDVVKFAGDALLAVFPAEDEPDGEGEAQRQAARRLEAVTARAAHCGVTIQSTLGDYQAAPGIALQVRVGIGAGVVVTAHLGGVAGRWELLVTGAPLAQVSQAGSRAEPGQVVVSREAWALIGPRAEGQPLAEGGARLERVREPLPLRALSTPALGPEAEPALRAYIPAIIATRIAAGQTRWLSELRRVTVLFINLPSWTEGAPLEKAQTTMRAVQTILERYEGTLTRVGADDKGTTLLAAFGLPLLAHEDDPYRATQAALEIQAVLAAEGLRGSIGITTGRAYCGVVGSSVRHEYTVIGDSVNVASRLMQAAAARERGAPASADQTARPGASVPIYCDEATRLEASPRLRFSEGAAISVKGKAEPVTVAEPLGLHAAAAAHGGGKARAALVGRSRERQILREALQRLKGDGKGRVVLLSGDAGIGKSRLVADLLEQADAIGVNRFTATADAIDKSTAYHAFRPLLRGLFGLDALPDDRAAQRAHVLAAIAARAPELVRLAPLLNALLSLDIPDTETTALFTGRVRADNTLDLLVRLLENHTGSSGALLALEDAHWLDSASWALTLALSQRLPSLLLVIATRPMTEPLPAEYRRLRDAPDTLRLDLSVMAPEESVALVEQRLGVTALPEPVIRLIRDKAQGNPFFSEELAYALRDSGLLVLDGDQCRLAPAAGDLSDLKFPDTIQGVVTSRIDRLPPAEQLTLKVASVIGRIFGYKALREIHPVDADRMNLDTYLTELAQLEFTPQDESEPELAYIFKHVITQEVAYSLMLFAQRRQLHRVVAEWYERSYAEDLSPYYPFLAHHWKRVVESGQKDDDCLHKAIGYQEKAGDQALERFANQEAIAFFDAALELKKEPRQGGLVAFSADEGQAVAEASLVRRKGTALLGSSQFGPAVQAFEHALVTLGAPRVQDRAALVTFSAQEEPSVIAPELEDALNKQDAERLFTLLWPDPSVRERLLSDEDFATETLRTYEQLPEIYYFTKGNGAVIEAALRTISIAERLTPRRGESFEPVLAKAYTVVPWALIGVPRLRGVAQRYFDKALQATDAANQPAVTAYTCSVLSVCSFSVGNFESVEQIADRAIEASRRIGDARREVYALIIKSGMLYYQARFAESADIAIAICEKGRRIQDAPSQLSGLMIQSHALLVRGERDVSAEVLPLLERAEQFLGPFMPAELRLGVHGGQAMLHWRSGNHELARQATQKVSIVDVRLKNSFINAIGYLGLIEVSLGLFESASTAADASAGKSAEPAARAACDALNMNAASLPLLKPHALRYEGLYQHLTGAPEKAHHHWQESAALAKQLGLPHAEALAHHEIGRHLPPEDPARQTHLARAAAIFSAVGATYHLGQTQALLGR